MILWDDDFHFVFSLYKTDNMLHFLSITNSILHKICFHESYDVRVSCFHYLMIYLEVLLYFTNGRYIECFSLTYATNKSKPPPKKKKKEKKNYTLKSRKRETFRVNIKS